MVMQQCFFWEGGGRGVNKVNCVVSKNIHTPHGGDFSFIIFQLDQEPPGKISYINNACALY